MIADLTQLRRLFAVRRLPPPAVVEMQNRRLQAVLRHAHLTVPFYRERFRQAGVTPEEIRSPADLVRLPLTTRADLIRAGTDATTSSAHGLARCVKRRTSGSTDHPVSVYLSPSENRRRLLVQLRSLVCMGIRPRDRTAVVSAYRSHSPKLYERLGLYRNFHISRLLSPGDQLLALERFQPTVIWAYATVLRELLHRIDYQLSRIVRPRAFIVAGEPFEPLLRDQLRADLDAEIFSLYGSSEVGIVGWECREHSGLHVNADQVVIECIGENGPVGPGGRGVAVVTTLDYRVMPLIRYRLGDIFSPVGTGCACGSPLPLIGAPLGREKDLLRLPSGRELAPVECDVFSEFPQVCQYRFVQERPDRVLVQLRFREEPGEDLLPHIRKRIADFLGEPVGLEIRVVERFREAKTKFRTFVSRLAAR